MSRHVGGLKELNGALYVASRSAGRLVEQARLTPEQAALVARADLIPGATPELTGNGRVEVDELVDGVFERLLVPEAGEVTTRNAVLSNLEWYGVPPPEDPVAISPLAACVKYGDTRSELPLLDRTASLPLIGSEADRLLLRRVLNVSNRDGDRDTIAPQDIADFFGLEDVAQVGILGGFLSGRKALRRGPALGLLEEEIVRLTELMQKLCAAQNETQVYRRVGLVEVPVPGRSALRLNAQDAKVGALLVSDTQLEETGAGPARVSLVRTWSLEVPLPPGAAGWLQNTATGEEWEVVGGSITPMPPSGEYLLEVRVDGERVDASEFVLTLPGGAVETLDLTGAADLTFVAEGGLPLYRNFVPPSAVATEHWTYELEPPPQLPPVEKPIAPLLRPAFPAGEYAFQEILGEPLTVTLTVTPTGTILVNILRNSDERQEGGKLLPQEFRLTLENYRLELSPPNLTLFDLKSSRNVVVPITPALRYR